MLKTCTQAVNLNETDLANASTQAVNVSDIEKQEPSDAGRVIG